MYKLNGKVTDDNNFFQGNSAFDLVSKYGSPLYVYNERIIRERCREIKNLVSYKNYRPNYSAKANSNIAFLQIVREEGLDIDAMSPGEIYVEMKAGFPAEKILFISNNVSDDEMLFAIEKNIKISVDSLSQLERLGRLNPGGNAVVRFNPDVGAGHHAKVITGGKKTKFGVNMELIPEVKKILSSYNLKLIGINQHIGSLFMDGDAYLQGAANLLHIAKQFEGIEFIDLGGGFGIPYHKQEDQGRLNLKALGQKLDEFMGNFVKEYGHEVTLKIEPGRYISAESAVLLGSVYTVKYNGEDKYIGTDLGFNVLVRPAMYDSHHDIEVYRETERKSQKNETVNVVGNICETGDVLAANRELPQIFEGDILGVMDAGAYGHVMSSNYNNRLRSAEVLIRTSGEVTLTRRRDSLDDIVKNYEPLK